MQILIRLNTKLTKRPTIGFSQIVLFSIPKSFPVGYEVEKMALGQFFSGKLYFPVSVSSHQTSILIFHLSIANAE